jgi:SnoaL-like domain
MQGVTADELRRIWASLSRGSFGPLEAALAEDARWLPAVDGWAPCENREEILEVMRRSRARGGVRGRLEELIPVGERIVAGFRPAGPAPEGRPLDGGLAYIVVTVRGGEIAELKGCSGRATALAYAQAGGG